MSPRSPKAATYPKPAGDTFADASPAAGRAFTDDGNVHEHRGLKSRNKGRPNTGSRGRRPARRVPIPPELVSLLRDHIKRFGVGPDGRLFRSENGNPLQPSTWWRVWQKVRDYSLTPAQVASPLLKRPYDLRHYADRLVMCPAATFPLAEAAGLVFLSA